MCPRSLKPGVKLPLRRLIGNIQNGIVDDFLNLILIRWFSPHPTATERNSQDLHLCPGPLSINHCVWRYSRSTFNRPILINNDGRPTRYFNEQSLYFDKTRTQQLRCPESESREYYDLILMDSQFRSDVSLEV